MRIQNNVNADNARNRLTTNEVRVKNSTEKLSSGFRINRSSDDAAGLAISEKIRSQIRGLAQAVRNSNDGISLIQTAEGGLSETHAILQRIRKLSVQSANGTYHNEFDREAIQKEVDALINELDKIAESTEFNKIKLLDGSVGLQAAGGNTKSLYNRYGALYGVREFSTAFNQFYNFASSIAGVAIEFTTGASGKGGEFATWDTAGKNIIIALSAGVSYTDTQINDLIKNAKWGQGGLQQSIPKVEWSTHSGIIIATSFKSSPTVAGVLQRVEADLSPLQINNNGIEGYANKILFTANQYGSHAATDGMFSKVTIATSVGTSPGGEKVIIDKAAVLGTSGGEITIHLATGVEYSEQFIENLLRQHGFDYSVEMWTAGAPDGFYSTYFTTVGNVTGVGVGMGTSPGGGGGGISDLSSIINMTLTGYLSEIIDASTISDFHLKTTGRTSQLLIEQVKIYDSNPGVETILSTNANSFINPDIQKPTYSNTYMPNGTVTSDPIMYSSDAGGSFTVYYRTTYKDINYNFAGAYMDFSGFGTTYTINDLIGKGFDNTCGTCDEHYSIRFTTGTSTSLTQTGSNKLFEIGIDNATSASSLVQIIVNALKSNSTMIGHFQQYIGDGNILYVIDNREYFNYPSSPANTILYEISVKSALFLPYIYGYTPPEVTVVTADGDGLGHLQTRSGGNGLILQIGANGVPDQRMVVSIGDMSASALGIANTDVSTREAANRIINTVDKAVKIVSLERARLGAMHNKLESTVNNLKTTSENLTAAESQIRDTDMATMMIDYTKNSILQRAAQAMLAQANQAPQCVLQLLQ